MPRFSFSSHRQGWVMRFPNLCCRCLSKSPSELWTVEERHSFNLIIFSQRQTYTIKVPVCRACRAELDRNSTSVVTKKIVFSVLVWLLSGVILYLMYYPKSSALSDAFSINIWIGSFLSWLTAKIVSSNYRYDTGVADLSDRGSELSFYNSDYQRLFEHI